MKLMYVWYLRKDTMNELKQEVAELRAELKEVKKRLTFTIDATKVEVFVPIVGHPEYSISSFGRVRRRRDNFFLALWLDDKGYYRVSIGRKRPFLHRLLAQAFIPNPEGKPCVDHIDGDPQNNSILNLRWATRSENQYNSRIRTDNTSGYKGVYFDKAAGKWRVRIKVDGKEKYLGRFHTKEEAAAVYEEAAKELHGEFFCNRR